MQWLSDQLASLARWLLEGLEFAAVRVLDLVLNAFLSVVESIPVPAFVSQAGVSLSAIPDGVWYFLAVAQFGVGVSMLLSALVLRFVLRRIPLVG